MLFADLDLAALAARRRLFDATGHYNRPDVCRLTVDDHPKPPIVVEPIEPAADHAHIGGP